MVKKLKARRMKQTLDRLEEDYLDPSEMADPAASDPELARKLAEGYRDPGEQGGNSTACIKIVDVKKIGIFWQILGKFWAHFWSTWSTWSTY